ncbi:hypothetical protein [Tenacibaculum geojense]|uniref:Uncharacterized protein n=1 Tax=Tenacibaculum geojense TaxID=915352 RepID=A0ABW3JNV1_9FLAO
MERLIKLGNEKSFNDFKSQYGTSNFELLKEKLLNNQNTLNLFRESNLHNVPTAENLFGVVMQNDYVNIVTYCHDFSPAELEKKNDYLFYSALIILDEWVGKYLPHYLNNQED